MLTRINVVLVLPVRLPDDDGRDDDNHRAEGISHDVQEHTPHVHVHAHALGLMLMVLLLLTSGGFIAVAGVGVVFFVGQGCQVAVGAVAGMVALRSPAVAVPVATSCKK